MVKNVEANLLGREVNLSFSGAWTSFVTLFARLLVGWMFLYAGLEKLASLWYAPASAFSAAGWLAHATAGAPAWMHGFLVWVTQTGWLIAFTNWMIPVGEAAIGLGLMAGFLTRLAAWFGGVLMFFFYVGGAGFANGYVTEHLHILLLLMFLVVLGAGRIWGLDGRLERTRFVNDHPWLSYLMG